MSEPVNVPGGPEDSTMTLMSNSRHKRVTRLTAGSSLLLISGIASADEITLTSTKDTTLYEDDASFGNGAGAYVFAGANTDGLHRRALIAFDVASALPLGTTVTDAPQSRRSGASPSGSQVTRATRLRMNRFRLVPTSK
jgi:hypothetical protein